MIIPTDVQKLYDTLNPNLSRLKEKVEPMLKDIGEKYNCFVRCDTKQVESFLQKLEMGFFLDASKIVDLFRATIVVPNKKEIDNIKNELEKYFEINKIIESREKRPELFEYDDIHLHLKFKKDQIMPNEDYKKRIFELQIKTFLEYGWQKATHELIYKGHELNWPNHRVAYQIKAMLEQADNILSDIERTAKICPNNTYNRFQDLNKIIDIINSNWDDLNLPTDLRRLASNIMNLIIISNQTIEFIEEEIKAIGNKDLIESFSLSPYQVILAILIRKKPDELINGLKYHKRRILISKSLRDFIVKMPHEIENYVIKL